ncbi:MAG TPA: TIR domain-containing protein [Candidatus Obscuribacterales bacterium]
MADVFISYSRKDKEFVRSLHEALREKNRDTWVDWENIPVSAEWWEEVKAGIEVADTFVFVITPDSVASQVCNQEIEHAVKNNKRLVPIVRREGFDIQECKPALSKHNWLFFREEDDFNTAFESLLKAIDTDLSHVKAHTRLLVRMLEWENNGRNDSFLLRGEDLAAAESWLKQGVGKEPFPTEQQQNYIGKSRDAEEANQRLTQAGQKARRMVRIGSILLGVTIATATVVGVMTVQAFQQLREAQEGTRLEREGVAALKQFEFQEIEALLTAMRAEQDLQKLIKDGRPLEKYPAASPMLALQTILDNIREKNQITGHQSFVISASFSPDGQRIVTASYDKTAKVWDLSGKQLTELKGHEDIVYSASFSPDGQRIVTTSDDKTAKVWDLSGKLLTELKGHEDRFNSASFSPDGQRIVTASEDKTAKVWDLSGKLLTELKGHQDIVYSASFSPDGQRIVTASYDNTAKMWWVDKNIEQSLQRGCEWLHDYLITHAKDLET